MAIQSKHPIVLSGFAAALWYVRFFSDPLRTLVKSYGTYGSFIQLPHPRLPHRPPRNFLVAVGADFNREVLGDPTTWRPAHLGPDGPANSATRRLGAGLIRMVGRKHEHYRRLLVRPLHPQNVNALGDKMVQVAEDEVESWPFDETIDLHSQAKRLMRTIAIGLLFGDDRVHGYPVVDMLSRKALWSLWAAFCPVNIPGTAYHRMLRDDVMLERDILEWARCKRGSASEGDLLALLLSSSDEDGNPLSDQVIAGQVPTLFGASYETCQNALTWTLILLDQHPKLARALFDELQAAGRGATPTFDRLVRLPLLTRFVQESMRLLPPVPQQVRVALRATTIAGYPTPPGSRVLLSSLLTNRNPDLYPEPDRFDPERWTRINPSPYEYAVFSAGPRSCPGYWFGLCAVKVALAAILARYRVVVRSNTRIDYIVRITMSPRRSIPAVLKHQDGAFKAAPIHGTIRNLVQLPN